MTSIDATPTVPLDVVRGNNRYSGTSFPQPPTRENKEPQLLTRGLRSNSESSEESSNSSHRRKARFAEATAVISPISEPGSHRSPFADPPTMATKSESKPSDFGFGYISDSNTVEQHATVPTNLNAANQPLKSAMKTPGTQSRLINPLSPTFREEQMLEKQEEETEKEQAKDLKVKTRVRMAKMVLRGVNFSCSLIVLAMLSTALTIFHATKNLAPRNNLPAWANGTKTWPQIVVLVIACVSLFFSVVVILAYCRGGHRRAEKLAVYYTMFAIGYFVFSIIMWLVGAAILQGTKANGKGQDLWGWSCKDNKRRLLFQDDVHYALVCRLQDWSLICCIIEIVVEVIVIAIYGVVFFRFYSKHKLRKSMDARDRARSDLYLAQLRSQSAPNTPGYAMTPRTPHFPSASDKKTDVYSAAEEGLSTTQFVNTTTSATTSTPFKLQAPPTRSQHNTPKAHSEGFEPAPSASSTPPLPQQDRYNDHVAAAPGEQVYDAVPIPGAYQPHLSQQGQGHTY